MVKLINILLEILDNRLILKQNSNNDYFKSDKTKYRFIYDDHIKSFFTQIDDEVELQEFLSYLDNNNIYYEEKTQYGATYISILSKYVDAHFRTTNKDHQSTISKIKSFFKE